MLVYLFRHVDYVCLCPSCILVQFLSLHLCSLLTFVDGARGHHMVLVIGPYTKADSAAACVFPWMGPKFTTSFILIVRSFTCHPNHDMGPKIFNNRQILLNK